MEFNPQSISIIGDVLVVIAVLLLFVTLRSDRQASGKIVETLDSISATQLRIIDTLDSISATQLRIIDTQSQISGTQLQISEMQRDQSRMQQDMLMRLAVIDAKGSSASPNG